MLYESVAEILLAQNKAVNPRRVNRRLPASRVLERKQIIAPHHCLCQQAIQAQLCPFADLHAPGGLTPKVSDTGRAPGQKWTKLGRCKGLHIWQRQLGYILFAFYFIFILLYFSCLRNPKVLIAAAGCCLYACIYLTCSCPPYPLSSSTLWVSCLPLVPFPENPSRFRSSGILLFLTFRVLKNFHL